MKTIQIILLFLFFGFNLVAQQYHYDDENRLVSITYLNGQEVEFSYDNEGNRIAESSNTIISLIDITPNEAINIYPNPDSYELNIQFVYTDFDNVKIDFITADGESILQEELTEIEENSSQVINVLALPLGSYFLRILSDDNIILSQRVIISDRM